MLNKNLSIFVSCLFIILSVSSCKKLIEIDPPIDKITPANIYNSDPGAASVLNGIYNDLTFDGQIVTGAFSIGFLTGFSADEISLRSSNTNNEWIQLYQNNLSSNSGSTSNTWMQLYNLIFRVNSAIKGISNSSEMTAEGKKQLLAESRFLRAFFYFYLVNLYGDVPLILNDDVTNSSKAPRTEESKVYEQIIADLIEAKSNISSDYLSGDVSTVISQRFRPNKAVVTALLSRVYLFTSKWADAEKCASEVISNSAYSLIDVNEVFKITSNEAIWQLERTTILQGGDGFFYIPFANGGSEKPYELSQQLVDSFETGDQRLSNWVGTYTDNNGFFYYPYKYKDSASIQDASQISEYEVVFRLGEQYLIRAEARAQQGNINGQDGAQGDLNAIRNRAGLSGTLAATKEDMIIQILRERRFELFTEWGHRWLDLKRSGTVDNVMTKYIQYKGGEWSAYKALYPIPLKEIMKDPALSGHQNPGY